MNENPFKIGTLPVKVVVSDSKNLETSYEWYLSVESPNQDYPDLTILSASLNGTPNKVGKPRYVFI
mgnify:CR=1 FL=1